MAVGKSCFTVLFNKTFSLPGWREDLQPGAGGAGIQVSGWWGPQGQDCHQAGQQHHQHGHQTADH